MSQFTIYKSSDGSAPTLDGTVGSLVSLLDKCLVTGYGAKAAAGWSKPFTGTNKAAFRPGAGIKLYLRVNDAATVTAKEAQVSGYEVMSDVDTGTGPFPTAAQGIGGSNYLTCRKSNTADATARSWICVADSRTMYLFVLQGDLANVYSVMAFGDFYSFKSDDAYNCLLIARSFENSGINSTADMFAAIEGATSAASLGNYMARGHTQLGGSVQFGKHTDLAKSVNASQFIGLVPFTNPEDGGIYLAPLWIHDPTTAPARGLRGRLRGIWVPMHPLASFNDGDTFSGGVSGELTGKTFLAIKAVNDTANNQGTVIIETSNTLETN